MRRLVVRRLVLRRRVVLQRDVDGRRHHDRVDRLDRVVEVEFRRQRRQRRDGRHQGRDHRDPRLHTALPQRREEMKLLDVIQRHLRKDRAQKPLGDFRHGGVGAIRRRGRRQVRRVFGDHGGDGFGHQVAFR